jgi:AraC-like DNA-binding protein
MLRVIINIQKMITPSERFSRYLPTSPMMEVWGVAVTGGGVQGVRRGESYPPAGHPADHGLTWQEGRVLGAMQIVLIRAGRGRFESRETPLREVGAGDVFVLAPQSWHRYAPDFETGWDEFWIEVDGPVVARLAQEGELGKGSRVVKCPRPLELERVLREVHAKMRGEGVSSHDAERGALGLQALALAVEPRREDGATRSRTAWVQEAEERFAAELRDAPTAEQLATELGVSYSHFRREFRRVTGMSPHRYLARLRLDQARRLIGSGVVGLDELADHLGYSSAFHLSTAFKQEFGLSPRAWRALASEGGS